MRMRVGGTGEVDGHGKVYMAALKELVATEWHTCKCKWAKVPTQALVQLPGQHDSGGHMTNGEWVPLHTRHITGRPLAIIIY